MYNNTSALELFGIAESSPYEQLGLMAGKIALYNFEWRFNTLVMFNILYLAPIEPFLKFYNAVLLKKGKVLHHKYLYTPQFVLFGQASGELADMLQWLVEHRYDNTARFVLVCAAPVDRCDEQSIMQSVLDIHLANVVFLKMTKDKIPEAFTVYPMTANQCWNHDPVKLNVTYGCDRDECYKNLFPEKFNNFYKCPFTISTFELAPHMILKNSSEGLVPSGQSGDLLRLVVHMLNATLNIITPAEGLLWGHYENDNWTGSLGDAYNGRARASMSSVPLTANKYGNFQISSAYSSMDLVWAAPMPALEPTWERLLYPLPPYLRIILFFMFVAVVFMNIFTKTEFWRQVMEVIDAMPTKTNLLVYSWLIFLGLPVVKLPSKNSFRLLVCTWIWYCLTIRSLYQATLVSHLKVRTYEDKMTSFSDVLNKKYPFGGLTTLKEYYSEDPIVYNNWKQIEHEEIRDMLDKMTNGETEFALALSKDTAIDFLVEKHATRQIQILPEKIVNCPTVVFFKKYSHSLTPFNKYLTIAVEGGFTERLYAEHTAYVKNLFRNQNLHEFGALSLVHFSGCLLVLALGCFLAMVFFAIELACGRGKPNRNISN